MSATELLYYLDPSTTGTATALSLGNETGRDYVVLDQTLFHPAGGGQKSDLGSIGGVPVVRAEKRQEEVYHFLGGEPRFAVSNIVPIAVDDTTRVLNSRYHTAGHVLGSVFEQVLQCAVVSGQHWPGESFMRFEREHLPTAEEMQRCREMMDVVIQEDRPVTARMDGAMRLVTVDGFAPVPCGGTHVSSTGSIGAVDIGNPRAKQRRLQFSYRLVQADTMPLLPIPSAS